MTDVFDFAGKPIFEGESGLTPQTFDPAVTSGYFDQLPTELANAPYRAGLKINQIAGLAAASLARSGGYYVDLFAGGDHAERAQDAVFRSWVDPATKELDRLDAVSRYSGFASKMLGGIIQSGLELGATGGPTGFGITEGVGRSAQETAKGTPLPVSFGLGAAQGLTAGATAAIPIKIPLVSGMGPAALQRVAYGAMTGAGAAIAQPLAEKAVYMAGGMPEESKAVDVFDAKQIIANAALGGFFGYGAHIFPEMAGEPIKNVPKSPPMELVDSAMTSNEVQTAANVSKVAEDPQKADQAYTMLRTVADNNGNATALASSELPTVSVDALSGMDEAATAVTDTARTVDPSLPTEEIHQFNPIETPVAEEPLPTAKPVESTNTSWSPVSEEGDALNLDYSQLSNIAESLTRSGVKLVDENGTEIGDPVQALKNAVESMNKADTSQRVIDDAVTCILGSLNGQ